MDLLSTGHMNACITISMMITLPILNQNICMYHRGEIPKVYHKFVATCSLKDVSCDSRMQFRGKKKLSQSFLSNKSIQLPEMMKLRPCGCVSNSAQTMKKNTSKPTNLPTPQPTKKKPHKEALTDIGKNKKSQKPSLCLVHPPEFLNAVSQNDLTLSLQ